MSEAHDNTEEEKSVSYLRLMRWGTRNFFWSDNDKHSTTRVQ
jgi:hypothetical protein